MINLKASTKFCRKCFRRIRTWHQQLEQLFITAKTTIRSIFSKSWWVKWHNYTAKLFHVFRLILPLISHCMTLFSAALFADEWADLCYVAYKKFHTPGVM